ncbi:MAG TPA: hypothetical protein DEG71_07725 [Clostridiales bacterium]|nr:hypothetical protein [Clostridiales bacterium]
MITISLCMIVRNEEDTLGRCLESVKDIVNEIIIVDTGSNDRTKEITKEYTDKLYDFEWVDDFSAARNYSFSKATMDYILWLDADDVLLEEDRTKLKQLKENIETSVDTVMMKYNYAFDEFGNVSLCFYRERLVKTSKKPEWHDPIHEFIGVNGNTVNVDICVTHKRVHNNSDRNLKIFEKMISEGRKLSVRNLFYYAKELYNNDRFDDAIDYFNQFLDSGVGWSEDNINACYHLAICYGARRNKQDRLKTLLKSFEYELPRAEMCCQLGNYYVEEENYHKAIFWYDLATKLKKPIDNWGFILEDCWGYIPNLQLCVCYYKIGNIDESIKYNDIAGEYKPKSSKVIFNKKFFKKMKNQKDKTEAKPMRIVQVAPDIYSLPPINYGGIEKIVYEITEELVKRGHEVYLYAPKGTKTSANLLEYEHEDAWNEKAITEFVKKTLPPNIDLIHDHTHHSLLGKENLETPTVCTIHGPQRNHVKYPVYTSKRARELYGEKNGLQVYNGITIEEFEYSEHKEDYLLYLGVLNYSKGTQHALDVAIRTNQKLIVAGPVHDQSYFDNEIAHRLKDNPNIQYVGPVGGQEKQNLLSNAKCMLFPTSCEEAFGLVMVEAMACGTPVLALANGAVPEVLQDFPELICHSVNEMAEKVTAQNFPKSNLLREYVANKFKTEKMVDNYTEIYKNVIANKPLRIVQVAPDLYPIPPTNYGGIERVIYDLTEELVKMGHEVILFAPIGSKSSSKIINYEHNGVSPKAIASFVKSHLPENIDIIHDHTHASVIGRESLSIPTVCTIHTPVNNPVKYPIYVSKSAQDQHADGEGYYVYNGINPDEFEFSDEKDDYILYMGMLAWYKGITHVLDVAEKTEKKLIIAGPIYDMDYHMREVEPRINKNPNIEYIGAVGGKQRQNLLSRAKYVLLPTICQEPFGLIMVEALVCGTPILALSNGAVPEVLSGFKELVCNSVDEMVEKVLNQSTPDPKALREYVLSRFTRRKMAEEYVKVYKEVTESGQ